MTWIEGVGDEVTIFFAIVIIVLVISLAWISTGIRDIPFISIIIIELTTRRRRIPPTSNQITPSGQTSEASGPETNSTTGNISQSEEVNLVQEDHGVQAQESQGVQDEHEGQGLQEDSTTVAERQDNINIIEVQKEPNNSEQRSNKGISRIGNTLEGISEINGDRRAKDESQENEEKIVKTELSDTELRHRRMTFFDQANKLDRNESESIVTVRSFRDMAPNNAQTTTGVENSSLLDNKQIISSDVEMDSCSDCGMESVRLGSTTHPVMPDSMSLNVVSGDDRHTMDNQGLRLETKDNAEQHSAKPVSENVASQPQSDGSTEDNLINAVSGMIRIRLKYFNDSQRLVSASPTDTIENFRRTHFSTELSENKLIRFIFNGQELRTNSSTLQAYNIVDNSVVHCLISQNPAQTDPAHTSDEDFGFDMGVFVFPLFGLLLAIIWYFRFTYRQFFNATSTLSLGGITFLFLAALCASLRRRRGHEHLE